MFLLIHEDFSLTTKTEVTNDDKEAAEDAILDIIRFRDAMFEFYFEGEWVAVQPQGEDD